MPLADGGDLPAGVLRPHGAFGFRSFDNCRIRSLLYAGKPCWSLPATITPYGIPKSQP